VPDKPSGRFTRRGGPDGSEAASVRFCRRRPMLDPDPQRWRKSLNQLRPALGRIQPLIVPVSAARSDVAGLLLQSGRPFRAHRSVLGCWDRREVTVKFRNRCTNRFLGSCTRPWN